jgi:hypothetical protein
LDQPAPEPVSKCKLPKFLTNLAHKL